MQISKLTCQNNFQILNWPVGLFREERWQTAKLSEIETIWHHLLSDRNWDHHPFLTLDLYILWYDILLMYIQDVHCTYIWIMPNMNAHVMNWNKLLQIEKLKMWPSVVSYLTIILVILFFFMASQQLAGNILAFFIVLLLFHPQCAGSLVVLK